MSVGKSKTKSSNKAAKSVSKTTKVEKKIKSKNATANMNGFVDSIKEIEEIKDAVIESPKNYNKIVKLLTSLQSFVDTSKDSNKNEMDAEFLRLSRSLMFNIYKIFSHFISKRLLRLNKNQSEKEQTVCKWLRSKYDTFQMKLFDLWAIDAFTESIATLKIDALEIFMKLIQDEGNFLGPSVEESYFPTLTYKKILINLLNHGDPSNINKLDGTIDDYLILEFQESYFQKYWDIKFYFFNELTSIINESQDLIDNRLLFSKLITLTKSDSMYDAENKESITETPLWVENSPQNTVYSVNTFKLQFEKSWIAALNLNDLTKYEYNAALSILHKRIIPFFSDAQKLMDFLTASYTLGIKTKDIIMAILALNGLWELMKSYNLEYPDFYTNLYAILTPDLLHLKEKFRFFRLLDLFMSSTHLSASIVASFIKRLARLSLTAPPSGIVCVIPFIYNLIKKHGHSTCMLLIHSTTTSEQDANYIDPYDETERDPSKTEAIGSSIWELETMINHYHPNVSALVKIFSQHFTKYSYNMEDFLDWSYTKLLDAEMKKKLKGELGIEFEKWDSMFGDEGYMTEYSY